MLFNFAADVILKYKHAICHQNNIFFGHLHFVVTSA